MKTLRGAVQPAAVLLLTFVFVALPMWLVLITSAKSQGEAQQPDFSLPTTWNLAENYTQAIQQGGFWRALAGSAMIVVPAVVVVLITGAMASWIFARRSGRALGALYAVGIAGVLIPPAAVTVVLLLRNLGIANQPIGLICVYIGMYLGNVIFFMTGFVRTIPRELEEAAEVDGAGPVKVFFRIIFPMLRPTIATCAILITLFAWNDVFYAFFVIGGGETTTLPLSLYNVASSSLYTHNWNLIFAYVVMMSIPLVTLFVFGQRQIISGVTQGAVK